MSPRNVRKLSTSEVREMESAARNAVAVARLKLIGGKRPTVEESRHFDSGALVFFGALAMRLDVRPEWSITTAAVDGRTLFYNPSFWLSLPFEHQVGVVAHEVLHVANLHFARMQGRELRRWNVACDLSINQHVHSSGLRLPDWVLLPGRKPYESMPPGKSAEEYYALLDNHPEMSKGPGGDDDGLGGAEDPGGCGGVRPLPRDLDGSEAEAKWRSAVEEAAAHATRIAGNLPANLKRLVQGVKQPSVDWKRELREFVCRYSRNDYCVVPETLVLRSDFVWVRADSVRVGDKLVGVDEYPEDGGYHRRLCETTVEASRVFDAPCIEVETDSCPPITVSSNHRFLYSHGGRNYWRLAGTMNKGQYIKYLVPPWDEDRSDTWLAGMFDGEGSLTSNYKGKARGGLNLKLSQAAGDVLERLKMSLPDFRWGAGKLGSSHLGTKEMWSVTISAIPDVLKMIGMYRPTRLLPKMQHIIREKHLTLPRPGKAKITSLRAKDVQPVVALQTTARTLITNGYISHNCWSRPNKRFISTGLYLPGMRSEELGEICACVDTSGSIGAAQLATFATELESILGTYDCSLRILYHDTRVAHEQRWSPSDGPLVLEPRGGGGTSHVEVLERADEESPTAIIAFTDLYTAFPSSPPAAPLLWCVVGNDDPTPPWGRTLIVGD